MSTPEVVVDESIHVPSTPWYRDWRVWLGVAITVLCVWFSMRDVPLRDVLTAMKRVDLWVISLFSVPGYVGMTYYRALRWRQLTNPVAVIPRGTVFRAEAVGFLVNNLVPLRIGELVRSWYLARESGTSAASILGTVVLERVLDVACLMALVAGSIAWLDTSSEEGGMLALGARLLAPVALLPLAGLVALRVAPERITGLVLWLSRPLPERLRKLIASLMRNFASGLGALSGGTHLLWIAVHSLTIWLVFSPLPIVGALLGFGIDLGSVDQLLVASLIILTATGVAVALPSAPGFFGTYQLAYKIVLVSFGVDPATALALGLLAWFYMWVCLTLQGLVVLRASHTSLADLSRLSGKDPSSHRR